MFQNWLRRAPPAARPWLAVATFAALLTLGEWARSLAFNGFTSLSLGYALVGTWLDGYAPVGGLYLASLVAAALAALLAWLVESIGAWPASSSQRRLVAIAPAAALALAIVAAGGLLRRAEWARPVGEPLSYRLLQSNVAQERKFDSRFAETYSRHLVDLATAAAATIIATPETAFTSFLNDLPADVLIRLQQFARRTSSNVFLGVATAGASSDGFNSVVQIGPESASGVFARYDKRRLMPFGEYSPAGFAWFTGSLAVPLKDMSEGAQEQTALTVGSRSARAAVGMLVCQEDQIGRDARGWAASATLLINPSNLAWFDDRLAIEQRLQVVQMRALEVARPILRIANTGVTAHIDARGRVVARLRPGEEAVLTGHVQPTEGLTPYARLGDGLAVVLCCVSLLGAGVCAARNRGSGHTPRHAVRAQR